MRTVIAAVLILAVLASCVVAHEDKCGTQKPPLSGGIFGALPEPGFWARSVV
jgi:hypothetical protein